MSTRHGSRARSRRALATLAVLGSAAGTVVISAGQASAAPPVFNDPPTRVYTGAGDDLVFTGDDPITGQSRAIDVTIEGDDSTCVVQNPGDEGHDGTCAYAQIQIVEPGRGGLTIDDSAIAYIGGNRSGDVVYNIGGPIADVRAALASLTYVPPDDEFETTDAATVTARLSIQDASSPAPQTANIDIDIRVEGDNDWPDVTAPADAPIRSTPGRRSRSWSRLGPTSSASPTRMPTRASSTTTCSAWPGWIADCCRSRSCRATPPTSAIRPPSSPTPVSTRRSSPARWPTD